MTDEANIKRSEKVREHFHPFPTRAFISDKTLTNWKNTKARTLRLKLTRGLKVTASTEHAHSRIYQNMNILFNGTSCLTQIKEVLVYELNYALMFRLAWASAKEAFPCLPRESRRRLESWTEKDRMTDGANIKRSEKVRDHFHLFPTPLNWSGNYTVT